MFNARYYKTDGSQGEARRLPTSLFDGVVNEAVMHQVVKAYLANQRQGTAAGKNRSAVSGGSRKPWRQKGTGRARQGTIRAPQWSGGGLAFPPTPHSWRQRVPRKVRALARRSAFNARAEADRVVLVDAFEYDAPRTARIRDYLAAIELGGRKVLVLTHGTRENVYLSARNLPGVEVRAFGTESVYDILRADTVVVEVTALDALEREDADAAHAATPVAAPTVDAGEAAAAAASDPAPAADTSETADPSEIDEESDDA